MGYDPISYHATSTGDLVTNPLNYRATLAKAVQDGENALQEELTSYTQGCTPSQDKIVLVGYSMGAWVINKWLVDYSSEWKMIKGVLMYGDPCWSHSSDEGLARIFDLSGCMPASSYPAPVAGGKFRVPLREWCSGTPADPVCGLNFNARSSSANTNKQKTAAAKCAIPGSTCPHFDYWYAGASSSDLVEGAKYMVQWLGVPELA